MTMNAFSKKQSSILAPKNKDQRHFFLVDQYWEVITHYVWQAGPWSIFEPRRLRELLKCLEGKRMISKTMKICFLTLKTTHHQTSK
jgi:hypothetical protein